jgi:DNA-3-methyladenine glycosylase
LKRTSSKPARAPTSRSDRLPRPERAFGKRLGREDLPLDIVALSRALVGTLLVRVYEGEPLVGRIVETEAYLPGDPASHAWRGRTARNATMFGEALHAYVYFIYGANWCLNVTAEAPGIAAAALIRACEPVAGVPTMRALRGRPALPDRDLARGPGNLCRAFAIGPDFDGVDLARDRALRLYDDGVRLEVGTSVRIGLTRAADLPLRFYARGNPSVSGRRALSP